MNGPPTNGVWGYALAGGRQVAVGVWRYAGLGTRQLAAVTEAMKQFSRNFSTFYGVPARYFPNSYATWVFVRAGGRMHESLASHESGGMLWVRPSVRACVPGRPSIHTHTRTDS